MQKIKLLSLFGIFILNISYSQTSSNFKKIILTRDFISEGVAVGDLNKDGKMDIVAGYYSNESIRQVLKKVGLSLG